MHSPEPTRVGAESELAECGESAAPVIETFSRRLQSSHKYLLLAAVFPGKVSSQKLLLTELVLPWLESPRVKHSFIPGGTGMAIPVTPTVIMNQLWIMGQAHNKN